MTPLFWLSYILRSLRRSGRRTIFATACVAVGVAAVVALQIASLTVQASLTSNVRAANGGDISVVTDESPLSRSDLRVFDRLRRQGRISVWTAVSSLHATAVGPSHDLVPFEVDVVSVPPYPVGGQPTFVTPTNGNVGALLRRHGDVLLTSVLAQELKAGVGDRLVVNTIGGRGLHVTVRGILAETSLEHSAIMTVTTRDSAALAIRPGHYTAVYANTSGSAPSVATFLRSRFPVAQIQTVQEAMQADEQQVHDFRQFMLLIGLLALLIAGIGTLNAMQSMLTWRRLEIAMLKAMGYGRGTLYALFGGEALAIGVIGGIVGAALGAIGSTVITDTLAQALALQVTLRLDASTLLEGVLLGIGASAVFTLLPIARAANIRPLEVLREGTAAAISQAPLTLALLLVVVLLFAILAAAIIGDARLAAEMVVGALIALGIVTGLFALIVGRLGGLGPTASRLLGYGVLVVLLGLTAVSVWQLRPVAAILALASLIWALTVLLPERAQLPLLIAARSLSRRQGRTAVTLTAFFVGVLSMSLTLTVALGLQSQISDALAANGSTNLVAVTSPSGEGAVTRSAHGLPGIRSESAITTVSTRAVSIDGRSILSIVGPAPVGGEGDAEDRGTWRLDGLTGLDLRRGDEPPPTVKIVSGRPLGPADSGTNHIIVRRELQFSPFDVHLGSRIRLEESGTGARRTVTVVGFYRRSRVRGFSSYFQAPVYGDRSAALALGGSDAQTVIEFTVDQGRLAFDSTTLQHRVPGALVVDIGDLTAIIESILNDLLDILAVITALALGAGVAVVANGVALSMLERRREIALFKSIGFGPGSVQSFVLVENALLGTVAGAVSVLGVSIGLGLLSRLALNVAIGFDATVAVLVLLAAATLAVVTAYLAARKPISVRPLETLRNE